MGAELFVLLDRVKLLLDLLDVDTELLLHLAQVYLELARQLLKPILAVALLLLDLHGPGEGRPHADDFLLFQAEQVLIKHFNLVVDPSNQSLDLQHLVWQVFDELLRLRDLLNVSVVLLLHDAQHVVHFLANLLLALVDSAFDLIEQDFVHLVQLLLEALLQLAATDHNRAKQ